MTRPVSSIVNERVERGAIRFVASLDDEAGTIVSFVVLAVVALGVFAPVAVALAR